MLRQRLQRPDALLIVVLFEIQVRQRQHEFRLGIPAIMTVVEIRAGTLVGCLTPGWDRVPRARLKKSLLHQTGFQVGLDLLHALGIMPRTSV